MDQQNYTTEEAATILRMTHRGVLKLIHQGRIKAVKVGRKYLITEEEIQRIRKEGA